MSVNANTVYLVLQINAGSNSRTQTVQADLQSAMTEQGPYSVVPVQVLSLDCLRVSKSRSAWTLRPRKLDSPLKDDFEHAG